MVLIGWGCWFVILLLYWISVWWFVILFRVIRYWLLGMVGVVLVYVDYWFLCLVVIVMLLGWVGLNMWLLDVVFFVSRMFCLWIGVGVWLLLVWWWWLVFIVIGKLCVCVVCFVLFYRISGIIDMRWIWIICFMC